MGLRKLDISLNLFIHLLGKQVSRGNIDIPVMYDRVRSSKEQEIFEMIHDWWYLVIGFVCREIRFANLIYLGFDKANLK
jgi:hypothetical protein